MPTGLDNRPSAVTYDVEKLVGMAWDGKIRVPHFQRRFFWTRDDVIMLFDSIVKGYPVGNLLLWVREAPAQRLKFGALEVEAPHLESAYWVVDGQQRVTSLASALHPDGAHDVRFALAYDCHAQKFVPLPAVQAGHVIPLPTLFVLPRLLDWFTAHPEAAEIRMQAFQLTTVLRQHPIPAYLVEQDDPEVVREILVRVNSSGKRLSRAEIFSAVPVSGGDPDASGLAFENIADQVNERRAFGRIDDDTVYSAVLARRGPDIHRDIRLEFTGADRREAVDFPEEDQETAFREGEKALLRAVAFLQEDAGIPHVTLLPYRYLLVVLARVFGHFPEPDPANRRLLRRWVWRTALHGPEVFRGGITWAVRHLCGRVRKGDLTGSVRDLLQAVDRPRPEVPDPGRFRASEATAKIILASWWALRPRDPSTGGKPDLRRLNDAIGDHVTAADAVQYVFPRELVPDDKRVWAANRLLVPTMGVKVGAVVGGVLVHPPGSISGAAWEDILASHLISGDASAALRRQDVGAFMEHRQKAITKNLTDFLSGMCEWNFEDTPPIDSLLVDDDDEDGDGDGDVTY